MNDIGARIAKPVSRAEHVKLWSMINAEERSPPDPNLSVCADREGTKLLGIPRLREFEKRPEYGAVENFQCRIFVGATGRGARRERLDQKRAIRAVCNRPSLSFERVFYYVKSSPYGIEGQKVRSGRTNHQRTVSQNCQSIGEDGPRRLSFR